MFLYRFIKVCAVLVLVCITLISAKTVKCRLCDAARSLDDCTRSVTCDPDEECYMDEVVTEQLTIEYTAGCRAKDVCSSAISTIGKRGADFIACSRCCDIASVDGKECNTKLCGIKLLQQNSSQCYFCDSAKSGGQGDVSSPTQCGSLTTCQTDEVCGAETFALAQNVTHRKTCLPRRICTLLTQKALEDVKRCKDPASVAAGLCGNKKRAGNMVCSACCGDAVCNGDSCEDILDRLYNLWVGNVLDFKTLKTTGTLSTTKATAPSTAPTVPTTKPTTPSTRATTPSTKATTPSTRATTPSTKATTPSTRASTKATTPSTRATTSSTRATTKPTTPSTRATTKPTTPSTRATTKPTTPSTRATTKPTTPSTTATTKVSITNRVTNVTSNVPTPSAPPATAATNGSSGSPLPAGVTAG